MGNRHAGFTVIELMIVLAVLAVLATIAAPSVSDLIKNSRMTAQANDLMTDLAIARAESVKRGIRTAICPSAASGPQTSCTGTPWNQGWIIFTDNPAGTTYGVVDGADEILKKAPALEGATDTIPNTITVTPATSFVGFRPSGVSTIAGETVFHLCDSRNAAEVGAAAASNRGRRVTISPTGRAVATRCTCPSLTQCN